MLVSDILKAKGSGVVTAPPTLAITDALAILNEKRIGSILIMESGAIVGILSERDIVRALAKRGTACLEGPVSGLMTAKVVTCAPHQSIAELMQIMTEKGLLHCDGSVRPQVFRAAGPKQQTQRRLLRDLLDRAFGGSPGNLVLQALSIKKPSAEELRQIRKLLDSQKGDGG